MQCGQRGLSSISSVTWWSNTSNGANGTSGKVQVTNKINWTFLRLKLLSYVHISQLINRNFSGFGNSSAGHWSAIAEVAINSGASDIFDNA